MVTCVASQKLVSRTATTCSSVSPVARLWATIEVKKPSRPPTARPMPRRKINSMTTPNRAPTQPMKMAVL